MLGLLGYYAAYGGLIPTFSDYLSVPSSGVKLSGKKKDKLTLEAGTDM